MSLNNSIKLLTSIIICESAGIIGALFTAPEIDSWYKGLNKPFFNPPNWIFGPVWTVLFILMGVSLYLVWVKKWEPKNKIGQEKSEMWNPLSKKFFSGEWKKANIILIFVTQFILNISWSVVFFGAHSLEKSFFVLLMLWFAIVFLIINFYRVSKVSSYLLVPYLLWVSFAGVLNFYIWMANL